MKKNLFTLAALIFVAALFTLSSCKKGDADSQSAEDAARGSYIMADAFALGNDGQDGGKAIKARFSECTFVFNEFEGGFSMTWDNCTDDYGITRNGTITVTGDATSTYGGTESASLIFTFENYTIEGQTVSGKLTFTVGVSLLSFYMSVTAENFKLTYVDGTYVLYNSANITYAFSLLNGFQLEISGTADGVNRNGQHFTSETEGMKISFFTSGTCAFPSEGIMTINVDGEKPLVLDYNSGTCGQILVTQKRHDDVTISVF